MAASFSTPAPQISEQSLGSLRGRIVRVTWATNGYATGGADLSTYLEAAVVGAIVLGTSGTGALTQIPVFNYSTKKLTLVIGAAGVNSEAANGSSDAQVVDVLVLSA